jgi:SPP1 gp7 family putative phage head morphogenesis protein
MDDDRHAYLTLRHQQGSQRYSKPLADKIVRVLNTADEQLVEAIASRYTMMQANGVDRGPKTTERLNDTLEAVRTINRDVYAKVGETTRTALTDLAKHEIDFTNRALKVTGSVNLNALVPSASFLKTLVETSPIATDSNGGGAILQSWIDRMETGRLGRLEDAIRGGLARGAGTDDLVKLIRGTKAKQYTDGVLNISRRSAQTVALTASSTVQNEARLATFKATRAVKYLEWSSVLDGRTSQTCRDLSGKVYAIDEPHPTAPRHPRCRSLLIPRRDNVGTKHKTYAEWAKEGAGDAEKGDFKTLDDLKAFDDALLDAPVAPKTFSPINASITDKSIVVRPRKDSTKAITADLATNAKDERYDPRAEFKSIKDTDFGKASFGAAFTDNATSMIEALMPEVNAITDAFGVPRLRAIKSGTGRYIATMGDGTLTMNATYFNGFASDVGERAAESVAAKLIAERDALAGELTQLRDALAQDRIALRDLTGSAKEKAAHEYLDKAAAFNTKRDAWLKLDKKVLVARRTDAASAKPISTWAIGDDAATRPYNATDYFIGIDRARNVMFHETAHHVHQMLGKKGRRNQVGKPPLEKQLAQMFFNKFHGAAPGNLGGAGLERKKLVSTTYATTNEHEWFAESFGLYMMGRMDLVDPDLKELIERLLDEVKNASA